MNRRCQPIRGWASAVIVAVSVAGAVAAAAGGAGAVKSADLRNWLTSMASDELEGRAVFTTGFGLAAARRFTVDRVEFAGDGLDAPGAGRMDFKGKDVKDAAVVWLGTNGRRSACPARPSHST